MLGLSAGLRTVNSKENRKLFRFTEEDKFVFNCIDKVVDAFAREFKHSNNTLALRQSGPCIFRSA